MVKDVELPTVHRATTVIMKASRTFPYRFNPVRAVLHVLEGKFYTLYRLGMLESVPAVEWATLIGTFCAHVIS